MNAGNSVLREFRDRPIATCSGIIAILLYIPTAWRMLIPERHPAFLFAILALGAVFSFVYSVGPLVRTVRSQTLTHRDKAAMGFTSWYLALFQGLCLFGALSSYIFLAVELTGRQLDATKSVYDLNRTVLEMTSNSLTIVARALEDDAIVNPTEIENIAANMSDVADSLDTRSETSSQATDAFPPHSAVFLICYVYSWAWGGLMVLVLLAARTEPPASSVSMAN